MAWMKPPRCMATMIGSVPLVDPDAAVRLVIEHLHEAPIWPELPGRHFLEGFIAAHVEGLPGLAIDEAARKVWIDTRAERCAGELAAFYERAMAAEESGDVSGFALTPRHASAFEPAIRAFEAAGRPYPCIKTHCVGPVSMQLGLADAEGRALYYDETYQDVLARQVSLQSRWAVRRIKPFGDVVIAFFDEPMLAAFGSASYVAVLREDVVARLGAAVRAVQSEGAVVGVHVCGNTDWSMIFDAGADLINYDAYEFGESVLVYADRLGPHLEAGGILAWGVVPASAAVRDETTGSLERRFLGLVDALASHGIDRELILRQSMLTPSCGLGTMTADDALHALTLLSRLSEAVRSNPC